MIDTIQKNLETHLPKELVKKLLEHYKEIKTNFRLGRHENNELNASKFSESVFRILEFVLMAGKYTPLGNQVNQFTKRCRDFEGLPATGTDDTLRIHIPRTLILILDIRNKRGVGHVSHIHNPNLLDATLVTKCSDWIFAELLRLYAGVSLDEAQDLVNRVIQVEVPVVEKVGDIRRVTKTSLKYHEQAMLLLYSEYPNKVSAKSLFEWVEHSHFSNFRKTVLKKLHDSRMIEFSDPDCQILSLGLKFVEENLLIKVQE